ncbi:MAG: helix-turn-helix domain-containing protein [Bacteroidia bacterium]
MERVANPIADMLSWTEIILWIGLYQSLLLVPVLWFRSRGRRLVNRLLALFVLLMGGRLLLGIYRFVPGAVAFDWLLILAPPANYFYGPLFYLYIKAFIEKDFVLRLRHLWHIQPWLLIAGGVAWVSQAFDWSYVSLLSPQVQAPPWPVRIIGLAMVLTIAGYIGAGWRRILRYQRQVKSLASFTDPRHLRWLLFIAITLLLPILSLILTVIVIGPPRLAPYPALGVSLTVSLITVVALVRPAILDGLPEVLMVEADEALADVSRRYESSPLTPQQKDRYRAHLLQHMDQARPYLDQELTLQELATQLAINSKYLSQVINELLGQNFMDFINGYRIRRAQALLLHPAYRHLTILAIAQEVGFKSKSAFYTAFKAQTGMTPSDYRQQQQGEAAE